jgi:hypothetical protein
MKESFEVSHRCSMAQDVDVSPVLVVLDTVEGRAARRFAADVTDGSGRRR